MLCPRDWMKKGFQRTVRVSQMLLISWVWWNQENCHWFRSMEVIWDSKENSLIRMTKAKSSWSLEILEMIEELHWRQRLGKIRGMLWYLEIYVRVQKSFFCIFSVWEKLGDVYVLSWIIQLRGKKLIIKYTRVSLKQYAEWARGVKARAQWKVWS